MAFAGKTTDKELDKGRIERTRVKRYWQVCCPCHCHCLPRSLKVLSYAQGLYVLHYRCAVQGRAPDWGDAQDDDLTAPRERLRTEIAAPVIVKRGDDAR